MDTLQNFYKDAIKIACGAGAGNIYLTTLPTPTAGYLVINPSSATKREIVRYSSVGSDGLGNYIVIANVSDRGLGGTTARAHDVDESVRMNYTAEHQAQIAAAIAQVATDLAVAVLAGAPYAKDTIYGLSKMSYAPDASLGTATITIATPAVITRVAHGLIAGDRVKFSTTGSLPTGIVAGTEYYVIAAGLTADAFRISATLGGSAINTTGSQSGVHTLIETSPIALAETDPRVVSVAEKARIPSVNTAAAEAGTTGTPSATNKFVTQDSESVNATDQSQTTQDGIYAVGEADSTTRKNLIAQSFIPTKTKIRGFKLNKQADSGTFTGTIDVSIQADNAGSPSGTPLVTRTITLLEYRAFAVGEFEAYFTSEYAGLVPGSLYWLVIDPSTSDNTNHPNLGTNTAGGYASGTLKYKNTTNGWVLETGVDLYFKTIEGLFNQVPLLDSAGKLSSIMFDPAKMPLPAFFQHVAYESTAGVMNGFASNMDGSVIIVVVNTTNELWRFERDPITGTYYNTHNTNGTNPGSLKCGLVILGAYIYAMYDNGANTICYRYNLADLSGETLMTFGTPIAQGGSNSNVNAWTDGQFIYIVVADANTKVYKESVSGTTFTQVTTTTLDDALDADEMETMMNDGKAIYAVNYDAPNLKIIKLADIDGSAAPASTTTKKIGQLSDVTMSFAGIVNIDSSRCYFAVNMPIYDEAAIVKYHLVLYPISKP